MAKLWARPVHGVLILAKEWGGGGGGGGAGPPWPYARSAPEFVPSHLALQAAVVHLGSKASSCTHPCSTGRPGWPSFCPLQPPQQHRLQGTP